MRFIRTSNKIIEFIEADGNGQVLNSMGFAFGSISFRINNKKVTFYSVDPDKPFDTMLWSANIPLTINDVEYDSEDDVSAALGSLMIDQFQQQIDDIETNLNEEIARATAKDASQDALISGLTTSVNNEIQRALSADTTLHGEISSERDRALAAEGALNTSISNETSARTSADAAQLQRITALEVGKADANSVYTKAESDTKYATKDYLSGLTENIYDKDDVNALLADKADKINAVASAVYNSQAKSIDFKNINNAVISSIDARDFIKDGMVDNAEIINNNLVITFNTDAGKEAISVSLTDIFDPNNYYNKTQIDNIVNEIESGITDDLTNYYTKSEVYNKTEVDNSQTAQDAKIDALSGDVIILGGKVDTISGDVITLSGEVATISGDAISSGEVQTMIDNSISGKANKTDIYTYVGTDRIKVSTTAGLRRMAIGLNLPIYNGSGISSLSLGAPIGTAQGANQINGGLSTGIGWGLNTKNPSEVATGQFNISHIATDNFGDSGNTLFSVGNGDNQGDEHNAFEIHQNGDIYISSGGTASSPMIKLQDHLGGGGGGGVTPSEVQSMIDNSISGKTNQSDFSAHTANTTIHVTSTEKNTWNNKSDFSGSYNDLTNKPTIPNYTAGSGITISNNVISAKIWSGTLAQYNALSVKDDTTIYLIYNS